MAYTIITGTLGQGKGLCTVAMMMEYLNRNKPIITNMDLYPERFKDKFNKNIRIYRVPDEPTAEDFKMCGKGNELRDPDENGLIALDELGTWFNSKDYNSKNAKMLNRLLVNLRKMGWDAAFQIQSFDYMNKEAKSTVLTSHAQCSKVDKIYVPIISGLIRTATGKTPRFPKWARYHKVKTTNIKHGGLEGIDRHYGTDLYNKYDTDQIFDGEYPHGTFCYLTPWHLVGRYQDQVKLFTLTNLVKLVSAPITIPLAFVAEQLNIDLVKQGVFKRKKLPSKNTNPYNFVTNIS